MRILQFIPILLLLITISSCDIIDAPFEETSSNGNGNVNDTAVLVAGPYNRKILLEEYTGFKCGNCPRAADKIKDMLNNGYADKIAVISVHAGTTAVPDNSGTEFRTDFRTPEGDILNTAFSIPFYPSGLINRTENGRKFSDGQWKNIIDTIAAKAPEAHIGMKTTWNEADSSVSIKMGIKYLQAGNDKERLAIYMVEDSVIDWQLDAYHTGVPNGGHIEDYVHRHVLRTSVDGGAWGRYLQQGVPIAVGSTFFKNFSYSFKGKKYHPKHCEIIAFVYDDNTKRIRQVAEVKVIK
jgi:hypothetical protein